MEIEEIEDLDLIEAEPTEYDPLGRFQTPVPTWMLRDENPCKVMARKEGLEYTLEFFYGTNTWQQAKKVCQPCPNKENCREYAFTYEEEGVWGETTYPERKRAKKQTNNKENV